MAAIAFDLVNGTNQNLNSFVVATSGGDDPINWSAGDWFGVAAYGSWLAEASDPVINEVLVSHTGADNTEFFELFGTPGASLDGLSVVAVDANTGEYEFRFDFGAGDVLGDNGFFLVGNPEGLFANYGVTPDLEIATNSLQNNSATYALVETASLPGGVGTAVSGSEVVLDAVASTAGDVDTGNFVFNAPVIGPDGTFLPAGVRRAVDGVDTDTAADFVIGNFSLSQDNTPTSAGGDIVIEDPTDLTIPEIQGAGLTSDAEGVLVRTTGIVTAVDSNGFYFQDALGDGDDATSDGLFVFTSSAPSVSVGDEVEVVGRVLEFGGGSNLSLTQISRPSSVTVNSSGNAAPASVLLGDGGLAIPTDSVASGIDFYESLEGMRVTIQDAAAVSPTDGNEIYAVANRGANSNSLSDRGTINNGPEDFNPERLLIQVDSGVTPNFAIPEVTVGDALGDVTGVMNYSNGEYEIEVTDAFTAVSAGLEPEVTTLTAGEEQLTVASYNVLNLDPNDGEARFAALGAQIVDNLGSPDIVGLQEVQDNNGAINDGTVSASLTLQLLAAAIAAAGGPQYEVIDNTFIADGLNGGQQGGNIRNAFLYNPERVSLVEGSVQPGALLPQSDPDSPFNGSRLPLAATFEFAGEEVTVISNHFSSKGGSVPLFGSVQPTDLGQEDPSINGSLNERREQAQAVNDFVDTILAENADANVVVLGDLNEFEFISPLDILEGTAVSTNDGFDVAASGESGILFNLVETLPENERYSFIFQGNSQALDHILVSNNLADVAEFDMVHVNTEFIEETSDHDPLVARLDFSTPDPEVFTLELLHAADQEAGALAVQDAPRFSAVLNALKAQDIGNDGLEDNTLVLSSGDAFIPSVFYDASAAAFGSAGIADIQIQNELGFQAIALGNHEFDFGTAELAALIDGSAPGSILGADFTGADFPYLSTNLDFSTDPNLAPLEVAGGQAPQANTVTSSVIIDVNGENIGVVGAVTPTLASISSPGDVGISPSPFDPNPTPEQLDALAAEIQLEVDTLLAANPTLNKVVLLAHQQQISIELALAERLENVDIIVAGGSNTRLFDDNDRIRAGDSNQGEYPQFVTNAGGTQTAVVNTDGNYTYVGRLVIDFDADGNIIPESYDATVSGAYATDAQGVSDLNAEGLVDPEIQQIVDAIEAQIIATESNVFGVSDVFLNGNRSGIETASDPDGVRTQETNLGNLTADANLAEAQEIDPTVMVSLKNGGGIRASIGQTIVPPGGAEDVRSPNEAVIDGDGNVVKPEGGIRQNDIQTALAFNNDLTLLTLTKEELVAVLEHGVSAVPDVSGRFPQISGVKFSYDPDLPVGSRIQNAGIFDENDNLVTELVRDGALVGDAAEEFRIVTLGFLAAPRFDENGNFIGSGDGYPFPNTNTDPSVGKVADPAVVARVNLVELEQAGVQTGNATFADNGTEQDALAEYLFDNFPDTPFDEVDTGRDLDERIQNLNFRGDTVLSDGDDILLVGDEADNSLNGFGGNDTLAGGLGNDTLAGGNGDDVLRGDLNTRHAQVGIGGNDSIFGGAGRDLIGGKGGNDTLFGGGDDDLIWGDDGDDILRGGLGNDTLTGDDFSDGAGSDTFVLALGEGTDAIVDFEVGVDVLGLADGLTFGALSFSGNAISSGGEILAVLQGVDVTALTESSFVTV